MRFLKYICIFLLVFTACKSSKTTIDAGAVASKMSAKKVVRNHISANFNKKTIDAKFSADYNDGKINQTISVQLKIEKDEVIWLKGTKIISLFKAKITPEKVSFYTGIGRKYFEGDFSLLQEILGTEINFKQLQNLFLGQAMLDLKKTKSTVKIIDNAYNVKPKLETRLFTALFLVNSEHFKLDKQSILQNAKNQSLTLRYPTYTFIKGVAFPKKIAIEAKDKNKLTTIDFNLKTVVFDAPLNTAFKIPKGYKRIKL